MKRIPQNETSNNKMQENVKVSVVVTTRNRAQDLAKCLDSLLTQDFDDYEIIVVDDASTDDTPNILEKYCRKSDKIRVIRNASRKGAAHSRNLGIISARGNIIAFTDDDCICPTNWLSRLYQAFSIDRSVGGVGGPYCLFIEKKGCKLLLKYFKYYSKITYPIGGRKLENGSFIGTWDVPVGTTGNVAYKREVFEKVGLFDDINFYPVSGEDADLKKRVIEAGYKLVYLPDLKVWHKVRPTLKGFIVQQFWRGKGDIDYILKHKDRPIFSKGYLSAILSFTSFTLLCINALIWNSTMLNMIMTFILCIGLLGITIKAYLPTRLISKRREKISYFFFDLIRLLCNYAGMTYGLVWHFRRRKRKRV